MNLKAYVAEFIGAFALLFCGVGAMAAGADGLAVAFAHGLAIAVMIGAFGAVSGGHFNPAVSFAVFIRKKLEAKDMLLYWVFQFGGAVAAVYTLKQLYPDAAMVNCAFGLPQTATELLVNESPVLPIHRFIAEMVGTFFLASVVIGSAIYKGGTQAPGLHIGLTITASAISIGAVSGSSINPARWLGSAAVAGRLEEAWVYLGAPLAGALLAGLISVYVVHKDEAASA